MTGAGAGAEVGICIGFFLSLLFCHCIALLQSS